MMTGKDVAFSYRCGDFRGRFRISTELRAAGFNMGATDIDL